MTSSVGFGIILLCSFSFTIHCSVYSLRKQNITAVDCWSAFHEFIHFELFCFCFFLNHIVTQWCHEKKVWVFSVSLCVSAHACVCLCTKSWSGWNTSQKLCDTLSDTLEGQTCQSHDEHAALPLPLDWRATTMRSSKENSQRKTLGNAFPVWCWWNQMVTSWSLPDWGSRPLRLLLLLFKIHILAVGYLPHCRAQCQKASFKFSQSVSS